MLDLDRTETEWLQEIGKLKAIINESDKSIEEAQARRANAMAEINRYERWIKTAREMFGLNTSDLEEITETVNQEELPTIEKGQKKLATMTIPEAIRSLLTKEPGLTATRITERLKEAGFPTISKGFRNVIQNRLHSIRKNADWLEVEYRDGMNFYSIKK